MITLLEIRAKKNDNIINAEIHGKYSIVNLDIGLKDICLHLRNECSPVATTFSENGYCDIKCFFNQEDLINTNLEDKDETQLKKIILALNDKLFHSHDITSVLPINVDFEDYRSFLEALTTNIDKLTKNDLITNFRQELHLLYQEAYLHIFPSNTVLINQDGFSLDDIKQLIVNLVSELPQDVQKNLSYTVNFQNLNYSVKY